MAKRDPYYDNLKFILITLVVLGHVVNIFLKYSDSEVVYALRDTLWVFHMPAFMLVSGLFAKRLYTKENGLNLNTVTFYLVLYVLFYCLLFAERCAYSNPTFNPFNVIEVPWYLLAIAILGASTPIVARVRLGWKVVIPCSVVMAFVSGFFDEFEGFLSLARVVNFAPFYYAGYYLDADWLRDKVVSLKSMRWPIIVAVAFLVAVYVAVLFMPDVYENVLFRLSKGCHPYDDCGKASLAAVALMRLGWFVLSAGMTVCVIVLTPTGNTAFSKLGSKTLQVYILHAFVYYALNGFGIMKYYASLSLPLAGLWVVLFSLLLTWLLALPDFPARFFSFLRRHIKIAKPNK